MTKLRTVQKHETGTCAIGARISMTLVDVAVQRQPSDQRASHRLSDTNTGITLASMCDRFWYCGFMNRPTQSNMEDTPVVGAEDAMSAQEIEARILVIFKERFAIDESRYSMAVDFVNEFDFDSYDTASLFMALEEEFSIDLEDQELERIVTVGDINELVKQSLAIESSH
jgi:acyl carrier protein